MAVPLQCHLRLQAKDVQNFPEGNKMVTPALSKNRNIANIPECQRLPAFPGKQGGKAGNPRMWQGALTQINHGIASLFILSPWLPKEGQATWLSGGTVLSPVTGPLKPSLNLGASCHSLPMPSIPTTYYPISYTSE